MPGKAAVLCGGGVAGISWMIGVARGLRDAGLDLAEAASLEAIGPNPLDPEHREPALEAGEAQAQAELDAVAEIWA